VSTDRIEILLAFEIPLAVTIPMLPLMIVLVHMVLRFAKSIEVIVTCFVFESCAEVVRFMHVVVNCILSPELPSACFAFPVSDSVYILLSSAPIDERSVSDLAVNHCRCKAWTSSNDFRFGNALWFVKEQFGVLKNTV
jgi:hypothetical protein